MSEVGHRDIDNEAATATEGQRDRWTESRRVGVIFVLGRHIERQVFINL